ncbi:MAG TPA: primosomal protein N', partial [Woeseiaceae bacterium]
MNDGSILRVAINAPLSQLFDYRAPADAAPQALQPGCRVSVPFGRRRECGMIMELANDSDLPASKLKRAHAALDQGPLLDESDLWLVRFVSDYYQHPLGETIAAALPALLRQGKSLYPAVQHVMLTPEGEYALSEKLTGKAPRQTELLERLRDANGLTAPDLDVQMPGWKRLQNNLLDKGWIHIEDVTDASGGPARRPATPQSGPSLNADQARAVQAVRDASGFSVNLLDGVTGSGKTEVYLRLIAEALRQDRQVLVLVPEIGLTPQLVARLELRLGIAPLLMHSSLSDNVRLAAWRAARDGSASLILGTRSAVFVPLRRPGLIIVDEEHDSSFKQQEGLRYSARDLAVARGKKLEIPVLLGSATPSLESLQRCREGNYQRLVLPVRAGKAVPPLMRLVDLALHPVADGLSAPVVAAMTRSLAAGGQVLVFLNRRGFAPTLICQGCGAIAECRRCDARMTVHAGSNRLQCHHCGAVRPLDT